MPSNVKYTLYWLFSRNLRSSNGESLISSIEGKLTDVDGSLFRSFRILVTSTLSNEVLNIFLEWNNVMFNWPSLTWVMLNVPVSHSNWKKTDSCFANCFKFHADKFETCSKTQSKITSDEHQKILTLWERKQFVIRTISALFEIKNKFVIVHFTEMISDYVTLHCITLQKHHKCHVRVHMQSMICCNKERQTENQEQNNTKRWGSFFLTMDCDFVFGSFGRLHLDWQFWFAWIKTNKNVQCL